MAEHPGRERRRGYGAISSHFLLNPYGGRGGRKEKGFGISSFFLPRPGGNSDSSTLGGNIREKT
ncbi:hypothetical protein EYF80_033326 [Liparis tanakae]|uniref:Uncharacterized protein n=1 Tax=Liparis tanakae TaxID=230148 RepID=A0A4Z2GSH9_9TELE|nr:hypothetical protein EYF80_033326 [Liparis tanakae]